MLTNPLNTEVKRIVEYGVQDKDSGKEMVFIKFETADGEFTWFGSLNGTVNPGKKMSGRDVTFQTMMKLGWDGDVDKFVNGLSVFSVPDGTKLDIADDHYAEGKVSVNKVIRILVPGFGMGVKKADPGKAKSVLAGMKSDIAKASQAVAMQSDDPGF